MKKYLMDVNIKVKKKSANFLNSESFIGEMFFRKDKLSSNKLIYYIKG